MGEIKFKTTWKHQSFLDTRTARGYAVGADPMSKQEHISYVVVYSGSKCAFQYNYRSSGNVYACFTTDI